MEGGVEELSIEQLASSISTYKEQLEQVRFVLDDFFLLFVSEICVWIRITSFFLRIGEEQLNIGF